MTRKTVSKQVALRIYDAPVQPGIVRLLARTSGLKDQTIKDIRQGKHASTRGKTPRPIPQRGKSTISTLASRIKQARKLSGLTWQDLEKHGGLVHRIRRLESGEDLLPTRDLLKRVSQALDTDVAYLRDGIETNKPTEKKEAPKPRPKSRIPESVVEAATEKWCEITREIQDLDLTLEGLRQSKREIEEWLAYHGNPLATK